MVYVLVTLGRTTIINKRHKDLSDRVGSFHLSSAVAGESILFR